MQDKQAENLKKVWKKEPSEKYLEKNPKEKAIYTVQWTPRLFHWIILSYNL